MSGRHGGRETDHAGARDFSPESPLSRILRHAGRWGGRENVRNLAADAGSEWVSVRYGVWQGLVVGKTYEFSGRRGKVLEKKENAGSHSKTGVPRVLVEWRD